MLFLFKWSRMGTLRRRDFDRSERCPKSHALLETLAVPKGYRAFWAASPAHLRCSSSHRLGFHQNEKDTIRCPFRFGGSGWIRTIEVIDNRFTVCPLWPLGYTPEYLVFCPAQKCAWSWWTDSNPRPADYKSAALPAELHQHKTALLY